MTSFFHNGIKQARRVIVAVVGFTVLLIGLAMIVLPGPAFIVIPVGLGILAIEFAWARRLLKRVKYKIQNLRKGGVNNETK
ncbi:MAG: PGPGW domain-containing protein [Thermodesulfovibrionales bacterium]|nr:PGPGW domain-containing protein [Thermodesulfovibrionales bacterium]